MIRNICILLSLILLVFSACNKKSPLEQYVEDGAAHFQKQEYDEAIESYNKALEIEPKSATVYNLIGMAYRFKFNQTRNRDYFSKEVDAFSRAIELDSKFWPAIINLAATYYYDGDKQKAAPLFKKVLELNPEHPEKGDIERMIKEGEE